jgi:GNAT superfamily N-acetyltransferase
MEPAFRAACEHDKPFLRWLEEVCMRDCAVALWGVWRPCPEERLVLPDHRIILSNGDDAGCVAKTAFADHIWVDRLYIAPRHQRRGLGSAVLRMVIADAAASGLPVRLSVLSTNPAVAFYIRERLRVYQETPERVFLTT